MVNLTKTLALNDQQRYRQPKSAPQEFDPWKNDINWPVNPKSFKIISSPASTIRRRYTYVPVGLKKNIPGASEFPFNWLQMLSIFMGTLAFMLFVKLTLIIVS